MFRDPGLTVDQLFPGCRVRVVDFRQDTHIEPDIRAQRGRAQWIGQVMTVLNTRGLHAPYLVELKEDHQYMWPVRWLCLADRPALRDVALRYRSLGLL